MTTSFVVSGLKNKKVVRSLNSFGFVFRRVSIKNTILILIQQQLL